MADGLGYQAVDSKGSGAVVPDWRNPGEADSDEQDFSTLNCCLAMSLSS